MQGQGIRTGHINCRLGNKVKRTRRKQGNVPDDYSRAHTEQ